MKYRALGRTGLFLSSIGLGTMLFGTKTTKKDSITMMHDFFTQGGNHVDTANVYGPFISEEIVGEGLKGIARDTAVLATKLRFSVGTTANDWGLSRKHILQEAEASLRRLQTDYIDLLYVHCWDGMTPIEETMAALNDLVVSGKVRYIGVSNFTGWQLMKSYSVSKEMRYHRFSAGQFQYSLVDRNIELEITDACKETGMGLVPWAPLGGGFLTGKYQRANRPGTSDGRIGTSAKWHQEHWDKRNTEQNWQIIDAMTEMTKKYDTTYTRIALAWLLTRENVSSVLIGPRTLEQYADNMKGASLELDSTDVKKLTDISTPEKCYPYSFIDFLVRKTAGPQPADMFEDS